MTFLMLVLAGCGGSEPEICKLNADIVPGCGAVIDGKELRLGIPKAALEQALGRAKTAHLGDIGTRISYPEHGVSGLLDDRGAVVSIDVFGGFGGRTADGIGVGSVVAEVQGTLGIAAVDPFDESWWYEGLTVQWAEESVSRLSVHTGHPE